MSGSSDSNSIPRQVIKKFFAKLENEFEGTLARNAITELIDSSEREAAWNSGELGSCYCLASEIGVVFLRFLVLG
ncbi:unnamed protein product [Microthlaspi erraticum]|uniref:Uncharacterized protein n=1 Tax=Microthlaspi erraticum TaxID=1685480 RepID=A0A6D2I5Z2_9BRAS|nr:unnamed protein product [Microthlaspi erraticum]